MPIVETVCKTLQNLTPLPGPDLNEECCVSYTIAFHVAVYDETFAGEHER
jgi:hypothetical protein